MNFTDKIKSFFGFKNNEVEDNNLPSDIEIKNEVEDIKSMLYNNLPNWDDIKKEECLYSKTSKKKLLIIDDYESITKIIKKDVDTILSKDFKKQLKPETIKLVERVNLEVSDVEICIISSELAPYIVYKTCDEGKECYFDYAIIDILYGDFIIKDGKKIYLDGIDIVSILKKHNPNVKTVLFTGCYLDNFYNKERKKIKEMIGEDYLNNNIIIKTESMDNRIEFFINKLFKG